MINNYTYNIRVPYKLYALPVLIKRSYFTDIERENFQIRKAYIDFI
jgi:hypothetical protein